MIQGVRCGLLEAVCQECPEKEFSIRSIPLVKSPGNSERTMNREFNSREKRASQFAYEVRAFPRDGVAEASGVRHSISLAPPTQVLQEPEPEPEPRLRLKVFLGGMVR